MTRSKSLSISFSRAIKANLAVFQKLLRTQRRKTWKERWTQSKKCKRLGSWLNFRKIKFLIWLSFFRQLLTLTNHLLIVKILSLQPTTPLLRLKNWKSNSNHTFKAKSLLLPQIPLWQKKASPRSKGISWQMVVHLMKIESFDDCHHILSS